jgi:hypothetical protein
VTATDRPYTDDDLRTEAARHLNDGMDGLEILTAMADRAPWDALTTDDFNSAHGAVVQLVDSAADLSEWAIALGAAGLKPVADIGVRLTTGGHPVAVQIAIDPDLTDQAQAELITELTAAITSTASRVLGCTPVA